ncbi:hypothetical protein CF98_15375 [Halopseudomonas bauzanensis]|nr:hypothetical protein CF98_15375 [Halopseudomonas bauzanensis]
MIGHAYDVEMADNALYPVQFAIPGAVECCSDCFLRGDGASEPSVAVPTEEAVRDAAHAC